MKSQKILYVVTQGTWGGAQRYVFDLAKSLHSEMDVTVAVSGSEGRDLQTKLQELSIPVVELRHLVRRFSPFHDLLAVLELAKLYRRLQPDAVHLNSSKAGLIGSVARLFGLPKNTTVIYTVHGWVFLEPLPQTTRWIYTQLEKVTARFKDAFILLGEKEKKVAKSTLGIAATKLHVIPLGITPPQFLSRQTARNLLEQSTGQVIPSSHLFVGTIANYFTTKGLDILIEAVHQIKKTMPPTSFFLVGEGPERPHLESLIKKYQLEDTVFLTGFQPDASNLLPAFDLFVLPSRKEGLPYILLEALLTKLPIITTDVGNISEIFHNKKDGLLIRPEDSEVLAEALLTCLSTPIKPLTHADSQATLTRMVQATSRLYLDNLDPKIAEK